MAGSANILLRVVCPNYWTIPISKTISKYEMFDFWYTSLNKLKLWVWALWEWDT